MQSAIRNGYSTLGEIFRYLNYKYDLSPTMYLQRLRRFFCSNKYRNVSIVRIYLYNIIIMLLYIKNVCIYTCIAFVNHVPLQYDTNIIII